MFLLRRAAVRAISATPSKALLSKPRSITTFTPSAFKSRQQQWSIAFQKRFASDEAEKAAASQAPAADAPENFAQTAAEAPLEDGLTPAQQDGAVEENLTPAQEEAQAEPTNAEATVGADALSAAGDVAQSGNRGARPNRDRPSNPPNKQLYIGNLYYEVTAEQLKRVFSRFGEVTNVRIIYDNRGLSRGFGYVEFENIDDAQAAVENLDMQVFEGRNLVVQFHRARAGLKSNPRGPSMEENTPSKTLFIGNMSFEMSDKDLNDLFRDIRNVMDVRVAIDRRTGQPRGFAHADFVDVASAVRAKDVLQAKTIYGRQLRIDFSKSTPRENKRTDSGTQESGTQ